MKIRRFGMGVWVALVILCFVALGGCSSLSRQECASMDWYSKGVADGTEGEDLAVFSKYQDQCLGHAITVPESKRAQYSRGREVGLKSFCTYEGGLALGQSGKEYRPVCSGETMKLHSKGYEIGLRELRVRQAEERLKEERAEVAASVAKSMSNCSYDWDCQVHDNCTFNKCASSGAQCVFSSDCPTVNRSCVSNQQRVNDRWVEVKTCR